MSKVRLGIEDTNQAHEDPSLQAVEPLVGKPLALRGMYVRYVRQNPIPNHILAGPRAGTAAAHCVLFPSLRTLFTFKIATLLSSVIQSNQSSINQHEQRKRWQLSLESNHC